MLRLRLSVSLLVLLALLVPLLVPATSARQAPNVSTPEGAAVFYSQLEAAGSFAELYQWMHPDAQQLIPQSAVVGWYANEFAPSGPGVITVTGVQMMAWTWEVTGTTYPNTAVISDLLISVKWDLATYKNTRQAPAMQLRTPASCGCPW